MLLIAIFFFQSYTDHVQVRNCWLVGLTDLDGSQSHVQDVQAAYLNDLIDIGVSGSIMKISVARLQFFGMSE